MTELERLLSHVFHSPDGCWYWTGCVDDTNYGRVFFNGKSRKAHRVSFTLQKGDPGDLLVCHTCDNPLCVNPDHLFLGTRKDNMQDMVRKGRCGTRRLTEADVLAIRADDGTLLSIAKRFETSESNVFRIKNRISWQHL